MGGWSAVLKSVPIFSIDINSMTMESHSVLKRFPSKRFSRYTSFSSCYLRSEDTRSMFGQRAVSNRGSGCGEKSSSCRENFKDRKEWNTGALTPIFLTFALLSGF